MSTRELKVVQILRANDLIKALDIIPDDSILKNFNLLKYLTMFPLVLSCSIRTKEPKGDFKPEYIIPQLLLQYVSRSKKIDGIIFPSTKVDYEKIIDLSAYNCVFPAKNIIKKAIARYY